VAANALLLGLGANIAGTWGPPVATLQRAVGELQRAGIEIVRESRTYSAVPLGPERQPPYLNAVILAKTRLSPAMLLRLVKRIEQQAGRRLTRRWGPRSLDIDILDYGGRRFGGNAPRTERGRLVLPHPELHRRAFVLVPLLEIAPQWLHPVLGVAGRRLLARLPANDRRQVRQALDLTTGTCDKSPE
jgi:2-amino-4-hydroxy-6-hydroxymethyldihydropteridine diphosphokinase